MTSQDINNTSVPLSIKDALNEVYFPGLQEVIDMLKKYAEDWADVPMLAKTHGQPASPTRLGKEVMVFVYRLEQQVKLLKEDLKDLSTDPREMEAIVRKATVSGWKSFYPIKKQPAAKKKEKKTVKNTFNAFPQRDYDFDALERTLNE